MPLFRGLLVSCPKNHEQSAGSEIFYSLTEKIGLTPEHVSVQETRISGLLTVKIDPSVDLNPVVEQLQELDQDEPFFLHCLKIRPVHKVVTSIEELEEGIKSMTLPSGSFRVQVNKRHSPIKSMDIITPVASLIDQKVDLSNPDWEVLIEIVADKIGYAIITPDLMFSTQLAFHDPEQEVTNWFLD